MLESEQYKENWSMEKDYCYTFLYFYNFYYFLTTWSDTKDISLLRGIQAVIPFGRVHVLDENKL